MAVRNSNLPSLIDMAHDRPLVLSKPAYINGRLYQPGEMVGLYTYAKSLSRTSVIARHGFGGAGARA